MSRVILQPAGNKNAREHYGDTIENPVSLERVHEFVSDVDAAALVDLYPTGRAPVWGVTPGSNFVNKKKWDKVQRGDVGAFSKDGAIFATGVVTHKLHSEALAEDLWGRDAKGATWGYIYFLDEIERCRIPYRSFNEALGYETGNIIRGFSVLSEEKSALFLAAFDLDSETHYPETTEGEYNRIIQSDSLDYATKSIARKEQGFLRKQLFGKKTVGKCGICGNEFPTSLLVAAHIKKRARCSIEERKDYRNIVMPMCKFGCDELYERGYIGVVGGKIAAPANIGNFDAVRNYLDSIVGNDCEYFNASTEPYFAWHASNSLKTNLLNF